MLNTYEQGWYCHHTVTKAHLNNLCVHVIPKGCYVVPCNSLKQEIIMTDLFLETSISQMYIRRQNVLQYLDKPKLGLFWVTDIWTQYVLQDLELDDFIIDSGTSYLKGNLAAPWTPSNLGLYYLQGCVRCTLSMQLRTKSKNKGARP